MRPFAALLDRGHLWHFNRRAVAKGVAIGLFFGLLIPVAQIVFAAVAAIAWRGNVPVAALTTFVTNPLTFPPIYFAAYHFGAAMMDWLAPMDASAEAAVALESASAAGWNGFMDFLGVVGPALGLGLISFALIGATLGYLGVHAVWRIAVIRRAQRRR